MGIFAWIIIGLIAGALAKLVMPGVASEPRGCLGTMFLGIIGAILGGWIWNTLLGRHGATGINLGSILVAFVGACILIALLRLIRGPRR